MPVHRCAWIVLLPVLLTSSTTSVRGEVQETPLQTICDRFAGAYSTPGPGTEKVHVDFSLQLEGGDSKVETIRVVGTLGVMTKLVYPDQVTALGIMPSRLDGDILQMELFGITADPLTHDTVVVRIGKASAPVGVQVALFPDPAGNAVEGSELALLYNGVTSWDTGDNQREGGCCVSTCSGHTVCGTCVLTDCGYCCFGKFPEGPLNRH